jgi:hypothetical protein
MATTARRGWTRAAAACGLALLALVASLLIASRPADAARLVVGRDGKVHACYKSKGAHRGTLRVVRSAKVRCQKKWRKVAWPIHATRGSRGETGITGAPGTAGNVAVQELEGKVDELLTRVKSLEAVLAGITNAELKEALAALANVAAIKSAVNSLCDKAEALTEQVNLVEGALGGLALNTLLAVALEIPPLPAALPAYSCPSF